MRDEGKEQKREKREHKEPELGWMDAREREREREREGERETKREREREREGEQEKENCLTWKVKYIIINIKGCLIKQDIID